MGCAAAFDTAAPGERVGGAILLPDGTPVRGRGRREPVPDGPLPQLGLFLGTSRDPAPDWPIERIDWPDFRTPRDPDAAVAAIEAAHRAARTGTRVEVTCGGGVGRSGTAIACLAVLAGHPVDDAVAWTRRTYRRRAVETWWQRRWVRRFAAAVHR